MSDTEEKQENMGDTGNYRDEKGRLLPGHPGFGGRPKGLSLLSILRDKLGKTIVTDAGEISLAEMIIEQYLQNAAEKNDEIAIRDMIDRIDGKPTQTNIVKTDKINELADAFKEIAKEKDE
jgi:hypothetical protein